MLVFASTFPPLMGMSPIRISKLARLVDVVPLLGDGNTSIRLHAPSQLAYGQSKPSTVGPNLDWSPYSTEGIFFSESKFTTPLMEIPPLGSNREPNSIARIFPLGDLKFVGGADEISHLETTT